MVESLKGHPGQNKRDRYAFVAGRFPTSLPFVDANDVWMCCRFGPFTEPFLDEPRSSEGTHCFPNGESHTNRNNGMEPSTTDVRVTARQTCGASGPFHLSHVENCMLHFAHCVASPRLLLDESLRISYGRCTSPTTTAPDTWKYTVMTGQKNGYGS